MLSTRTRGKQSLPHESARRTKARRDAIVAVSRRSEFALSFFGRIFERTLIRDFHALRVLRARTKAENAPKRIVIYANHPSWWDGVLYVVLARRLFEGYKAFAPIDASMLERYRFLSRLGAFGVDQHSSSGATDFIEACRHALRDDKSMLFIAAQGRFADVRERPLDLSPGLAHVADVAPDAIFVPLAVETTFWIEKRPELLIAFGEMVTAEELAVLGKKDRMPLLEQKLVVTMDLLREASVARKADAFDLVLAGKSGIDAIYDTWRRLSAFARGQKSFRPGHGSNEP